MITSIVNEYRSANTYIVELEDQQVALIDCGGPSLDKLVQWLDLHKKSIAAVFLTHEHGDHCVGLMQKERIGYEFPIYCSQACGVNIADKRLNFSLYSDEIDTFEALFDFTPVNDFETIKIAGHFFKIFHTPGHSPGSICIQYDDRCLFTGDTILEGVKTLLTLPSSNKEDFQKSIEKMKAYLKSDWMIYPGHGDKFLYEDLDSTIMSKVTRYY